MSWSNVVGALRRGSNIRNILHIRVITPITGSRIPLTCRSYGAGLDWKKATFTGKSECVVILHPLGALAKKVQLSP